MSGLKNMVAFTCILSCVISLGMLIQNIREIISNILILFKDLLFLSVFVVKINKIKTNLYFGFFHQALVQAQINIKQ